MWGGIWIFSIAITLAYGGRPKDPADDAAKDMVCRTGQYYFYHPTDCHIFYKCDYFNSVGVYLPVKTICGPGTVFSKERRNTCVPPKKSGRPECENYQSEINGFTTKDGDRLSILSVKTVDLTAPVGDNVLCKKQGFHADLKDCSKFHLCIVNGMNSFKNYEYQCPPDLVWETERRWCVFAWASTREECRTPFVPSDHLENPGAVIPEIPMMPGGPERDLEPTKPSDSHVTTENNNKEIKDLDRELPKDESNGESSESASSNDAENAHEAAQESANDHNENSGTPDKDSHDLENAVEESGNDGVQVEVSENGGEQSEVPQDGGEQSQVSENNEEQSVVPDNGGEDSGNSGVAAEVAENGEVQVEVSENSEVHGEVSGDGGVQVETAENGGDEPHVPGNGEEQSEVSENNEEQSGVSENAGEETVVPENGGEQSEVAENGGDEPHVPENGEAQSEVSENNEGQSGVSENAGEETVVPENAGEQSEVAENGGDEPHVPENGEAQSEVSEKNEEQSGVSENAGEETVVPENGGEQSEVAENGGDEPHVPENEEEQPEVSENGEEDSIIPWNDGEESAVPENGGEYPEVPENGEEGSESGGHIVGDLYPEEAGPTDDIGGSISGLPEPEQETAVEPSGVAENDGDKPQVPENGQEQSEVTENNKEQSGGPENGGEESVVPENGGEQSQVAENAGDEPHAAVPENGEEESELDGHTVEDPNQVPETGDPDPEVSEPSNEILENIPVFPESAEEPAVEPSDENESPNGGDSSSNDLASANCPIGNLTGDQIPLVCPTSFRRHPKYCNLFYQCASENEWEYQIAVLSCPGNKVFEASKCQCLPAAEVSQPCTGQYTNQLLHKKLKNHSLAPIAASHGILCPGAGHYPHTKKCGNLYYKCIENSEGSINGYLYKCPPGYIYWPASRRCEEQKFFSECAEQNSQEYGFARASVHLQPIPLEYYF